MTWARHQIRIHTLEPKGGKIVNADCFGFLAIHIMSRHPTEARANLYSVTHIKTGKSLAQSLIINDYDDMEVLKDAVEEIANGINWNFGEFGKDDAPEYAKRFAPTIAGTLAACLDNEMP